jgi:SAM-dependent methyltransferase
MALNRIDILLQGLDIGRLIGAEVGPLDKPVVPKGNGDVFYIDHCDTEALRTRWSTDTNVDVKKLHVDAVWGENTLKAALTHAHAAQAPGKVWPGLDYMVASHVIEHVPDLITWLQEVKQALKVDGTLRLAVPDRRYTFDRLRRTSTLHEALDAYVRKRRVPSGSRVLDFALNMRTVDCHSAWLGTLDEAQLVRVFPFADAVALARDAEENGTYHDVHCWVFTPESFAELMLELAKQQMLGFSCQWLEPTAKFTFEFFAALQPCDDPQLALQSWLTVSAQLNNADHVEATPSHG